MLDRRGLLALGAATAAAGLIGPGLAAAQGTPTFQQPKLPYAEDALAPTISARTVGLHYGKHHKAYFDKLNQLAAGTPYAGMELAEVVTRSKTDGKQDVFNNAGQAWNHNFYWQQFAGGPAAPSGDFLSVMQRDFGGFDNLVTKMVEGGDKVFGTGWVWLVRDGDRLAIMSLQDADNPLAHGKVPLAGIDVWEHAYYLDYENRRPEHVRKVLTGLVNWQFVGKQMGA